MSREVFVVERRKDRSGWWIILIAAALIAYWKALIFACMIAGVYWLVRKGMAIEQARYDRKISRDAAKALRCDYENMMAMAGDPIGVYGDYTPPTMPMTGFNYQPLYYDNHDDGLRDWK
jgi:hypothetical protein